MTMISKDIFFRLMKENNAKTLKELSNMYGYKDNWATTTRKREGIPFEACAMTCEKFGVSMDYLLFGEESNSIDINELKTSITEGIFAMMQTDMIVLSKDVKISTMANIITSEIVENCDINMSKKVRKAI
ncbi:hypothetical protein [Colwellia sp. Bg11-28]|uniref:hypothetical protein n=1 Tax=Colwellia sp. Bg11-28 TaxID=2058305 RepID=UPI000C33C931|nr:hypothetical protein [Colwellia sp. Bg11-28]PKH86234.1 hypothetical protein CXF79_16065 [Colwellia sp. Bg11-28]